MGVTEEMLDVRQAAARSGRGAETVRRWIGAGVLPAQRQGRRLMVSRKDLDGWLARRGHRETMTLRDWLDALEATAGATSTRSPSAADLILEDRRRRSGRGRR